MAKTQNLSLSPTKISGTCGRLMCCLKYEQDAYEDLIRNSPKMDSFVDTPEGRGTVVEVDLLRQRVKVKLEDRPEVIAYFANADIAVWRNGKAKKNDPPVPEDWAPVSGAAPRKKPQQEEEGLHLEPIRFRYSTEQIVEEPEAEVTEKEPKGKEALQNRRNRRNRRRQNRSAAAAEQSQPKAQTPAAETKQEGEAKRPNRRNHRRRRRPQKSEPTNG